jgi:hypothetical protein
MQLQLAQLSRSHIPIKIVFSHFKKDIPLPQRQVKSQNYKQIASPYVKINFSPEK